MQSFPNKISPKDTKKILMKFSEKVSHGPETKRLYFGENLDQSWSVSRSRNLL